jgi:hypothetical protein
MGFVDAIRMRQVWKSVGRCTVSFVFAKLCGRTWISKYPRYKNYVDLFLVCE